MYFCFPSDFCFVLKAVSEFFSANHRLNLQTCCSVLQTTLLKCCCKILFMWSHHLNNFVSDYFGEIQIDWQSLTVKVQSYEC